MRPLPILALISSGIVPACGAERTPTPISVSPAEVSLAQDFSAADDKIDANDKEALVRRMYKVQWGKQEPGCEVGVLLTGPKDWKPVSLKPAVLIDAKTDSGETLSALSS